MKKLLLAILLLSAVHYSYAQNTFPVNGNVGIGTINPLFKLHVNGAGYFVANANSQTYSPLNMLANGPQVIVSEPNNTVTSSLASIQLSAFNAIGAIALDYKTTFGGDLLFGLNDGSSYSAIERMRITSAGKVGIGTTQPDAPLTVAGTIHATDVLVDQTVKQPDYVFDKDYDLTSLKDVKTYIDKNHHLPEIPSAAQVAKEGINLGEMNTKLLKKIEELTLYLIEEHKQLQDQKDINKNYQEQLDAIKKQLKIN